MLRPVDRTTSVVGGYFLSAFSSTLFFKLFMTVKQLFGGQILKEWQLRRILNCSIKFYILLIVLSVRANIPLYLLCNGNSNIIIILILPIKLTIKYQGN